MSVVWQCLTEGYEMEVSTALSTYIAWEVDKRLYFTDRYKLQVNVNTRSHNTFCCMCVCCWPLLSNADGKLRLKLKWYIASQNSWWSLVIVKTTGLFSVNSSRQQWQSHVREWKRLCEEQYVKPALIFNKHLLCYSNHKGCWCFWPLNVFEYLVDD